MAMAVIPWVPSTPIKRPKSIESVTELKKEEMAKRDFGATLVLWLTLNKAIAWSFAVVDDCVMAADIDNLAVVNS